MPTVKLTDGTDIYYEVNGPSLDKEDVKTLVFVHGAPGLVDSRLYQVFWGQFASDQLRVVFYEQRGSGRSTGDAQPEKLNIRQHAADIHEFCGKLGIEKPIVGGVSQGGYVSIVYAEIFPDDITALIACNTEAKRDTNIRVEAHQYSLVNYFGKTEEQAVAVSEALRACDEHWTDEAYKQFMPYYAKNSYRPDEIAACVKRPETWQNFMAEEFPVFDLTPGLKDITCPVLYLVGEFDCVHPPKSAEITIAGMENAQVTHCVIPDTADPVYRDQPEAAAAAVGDFLKKLLAAPVVETRASAFEHGGGAAAADDCELGQ